MKKICTSLLVAFLTTGFLAVTSQASVVCKNMEITRLGLAKAKTPSSYNRVVLFGGSCGLTSATPFFLHEDLGAAGYATLLTALSLDKTVTVRVPDNPEANDLITEVHVDF